MHLRTIVTCFILFILFSCKRDPALIHLDNLNGNKLSIFGHGGMGISHRLPMNSKESIGKCLEIGADGSEIDVQVTKDGIPVAFHDRDLADATGCSGQINETTWDEIKDCEYRQPLLTRPSLSRLDDLFKGIPSFREYTFTFDCKPYSNNDAYLDVYAAAITGLVRDHNLLANVLVESQDTSLLRKLRNAEPSLKLFIYPSSFEEGLKVAESMNLYGITIHHEAITKEQVSLAHSKGLFITLWGMHSEHDNLSAIQKDPDFVQPDALAHMLKIFHKYRRK